MGLCTHLASVCRVCAWHCQAQRCPHRDSPNVGCCWRSSTGTVLTLTKTLGWHPLSLLPLTAKLVHVGMLLCLGQSSSSLFPAGSVDFGPDVTSSDKSIKVLLNSQDKVSPHKPRGSPLGGRRQSGPFPPLSLSRLGAAGPLEHGFRHRDQGNLLCRCSSTSEPVRVPACRTVSQMSVLRSLKESPGRRECTTTICHLRLCLTGQQAS